MPKIKYQEIRLSKASLSLIEVCNKIIREYTAAGYILTLRQLYYQLVSRDIIPNKQSEYKRVGSIVNDGRLAGLIDWSALEDRTRNVRSIGHWDSPEQIIQTVSEQYAIDKWESQSVRPECFTPSTPVLVDGIPTSIGAVGVGDVVMTHAHGRKTVTSVTTNNYNGMMLRVKAAGLMPIEVTPEHPFWVTPMDRAYPKRKGSERKFNEATWIPSKSLGKFDLLRVPLLESEHRKTAIGRVYTVSGGTRSLAYKIPINTHTLKICGLYIAEGSVRADGRTIQFTFNATETDYAEVVTSWATKIGVSYSTAEGSGTLVVYLYSKAVAEWFEECFGTGAFEKRLPRWVMYAPLEEQMALIKYYFNGDGCLWDESRSALVATTVSSVLAQQLQLVFLWGRFGCSLDTTMDHGNVRYRVSIGGKSADELAALWDVPIPEKGKLRNKRYNHIRFTSHYACFPVRSVEEFAYDGKVCNLEVDGDSSYCVPVAVHNCWIEKDALVGVIERICDELDIAYFSCRGYTSQSEMWGAAQRFIKNARNGQETHVIHLGDHDPSGIDMSRDIEERIQKFMAHHGYGDMFNFTRIALNRNQIDEYDPPPNPAKSTDSRFQGYIDIHGDESWELDALEPQVLSDLVRDQVDKLRDDERYEEKVTQEEIEKDQLVKVYENWDGVTEFLASR